MDATETPPFCCLEVPFPVVKLKETNMPALPVARDYRLAWIVLAIGIFCQAALLWHYIHANSAVFDEGMHISAGYRYWQCGDYGINPEHPPLVKLIASIPIRHWRLGNFNSACGSHITTNFEFLGVVY